MKIDLHVHSKYSSEPSQWILKKVGCPESFVEPLDLYHRAMRQGLDAVTITDHDCIDGSLDIAHLPMTFVSEEVTAVFPEDRCQTHIVVYNIDEAIHQDLQKLRHDIYDLAAYLHQKRLLHTVAHPFFAVNDKLTLWHVERLFLLFKHFEVNGTRDRRLNEAMLAVLGSLNPTVIAKLSEAHGIEPAVDEPWVKFLTGGSDDHSGLHMGRMATVVPGAKTVDEFLRGFRRGESKPEGVYSTPLTMAHNLYAIGYQFYRDKYDLKRYAGKDPFLRFLDRVLTPVDDASDSLYNRTISYLRGKGVLRKTPKEAPKSIHRLLRHEAEKIFYQDEELRDFAKTGQSELQTEEIWFNFARKTTNKILAGFGDMMLEDLNGANIFQVLQNLGSASGMYTALSPYFVTYSLYSKDQVLTEQVRERFLGKRAIEPEDVKLAHFTDTFFETNGVALTLQQQVKTAQKLGRVYHILTCDPQNSYDEGGVTNFQPIGVWELPEYPEQKLYYPPLLDMLHHVYAGGYTHIKSATPGPIGLCGLLISKLLKLPFYGTYHTSLPQYAAYLTGDDAMEDLMWRYMIWFYNAMDRIYVPSLNTGQDLVDHGIPEDKILVYPRGVDTERFNPKYRNGFYKRYSMNGSLKLLYVGRVSKEKNLHILEQAYKDLLDQGFDLDLVIVGDGPYRQEMEERLAGLPCVFTGSLYDNDLAQAFASADLFIFPSTTDTFGNVILEAQASGLPVLVTDMGGPQENLLPGQTGDIVRGDDPIALRDGIVRLTSNPERLRGMGEQARHYTEGRCFEKAFEDSWELFM